MYTFSLKLKILLVTRSFNVTEYVFFLNEMGDADRDGAKNNIS